VSASLALNRLGPLDDDEYLPRYHQALTTASAWERSNASNASLVRVPVILQDMDIIYIILLKRRTLINK